MKSKEIIERIAALVGVELSKEEAKVEEPKVELAEEVKEEKVELAEEEKPMEDKKEEEAPKEEEKKKDEEEKLAVEDLIAALEARIKAIEDYMKADKAEDVAEEVVVEPEMKKEEKMSKQKKFTGAPKEDKTAQPVVKSTKSANTIDKVWERLAQNK
jgi:hypothetical protein